MRTIGQWLINIGDWMSTPHTTTNGFILMALFQTLIIIIFSITVLMEWTPSALEMIFGG